MSQRMCLFLAGLILVCFVKPATAEDRSLRENPALAAWFESEVEEIEADSDLMRYGSLAEWETDRPKLRNELFDMLGLDPRPERTPLQAVTTGTTVSDEFVVERVHFQSMPGLYVTGDLYLPKTVTGPLPTILYLCGHGGVKKDGVSFGNKVHYQHHGEWFARNGYACLTIDSLQLGEIEAIHHGTYKFNRWWWNSRGYTPAGVEAWNCIRALDYLETRPEVDAKRFGVTGRSGGGAYSWWIAALDDRIQCAVPVAGITSLRDHVVNGCVEGHCDCMFMVNTFRWDYAKVAALLAPRPLLISNTDKDTIFPLEGVIDIHRQVRHIYRLYDADKNLGLQITEGPHKDTQELHIHAFRWFNRFLKNDQAMITTTAVPFLEPEDLKVFPQLPSDELNTRIDEIFVPAAPIPSTDEIIADQQGWFDASLQKLRDRCFRAWPTDAAELSQGADDIETDSLQESTKFNGKPCRVATLTFTSQPGVILTMRLLCDLGANLKELRTLEVLVAGEETAYKQGNDYSSSCEALAIVSLRGMAENAWVGSDSKRIQIERRFQLIGATADTMRVWDLRRAIQVLRTECPELKELVLRSDGRTQEIVLLASLFEQLVSRIECTGPWPADHEQSAILNLSRTLPIDLLPALAAWRADLTMDASRSDSAASAALSEHANWRGKSLTFGREGTGPK